MRLFIVSIMLAIVGCATTTVTKDPGPNDKGIRYYRPKPYLLLQPHEGNSPEYVTINLAYLPDFTEEYSIRARAGLGWNKTEVSLENGWNLTNMKQELDSQTDENLTAVADLIGKIKPSEGGVNAATPTVVVKAKNVPFGFYESVISRGEDGCKHLYGWRYVGFMPFAPCPVISTGVECTDCYSSMLFGLAMIDGAMAFVPLSEIAESAPVVKGARPGTPNSTNQFRSAAVPIINRQGELSVSESDVLVEPLGPTTYSVAIQVDKNLVARANMKKDAIRTGLLTLAASSFTQTGVDIKVTIVEKTP